MFRFLRDTSPHQPSLALQQALSHQGLPPDLPVESLRVLTMNGRYAGRSVRYFRVFDPHRSDQRDVSVRAFKDLDGHPELVVGSGHQEHDGALALTERVAAAPAPTPTRERADRAVHADDEHLVFWDAEGSSSSAAHLSEAAATWLHARSTQPAELVPELARLGRV